MKRHLLHFIIGTAAFFCLSNTARAEFAITMSKFSNIERQEALASIGRLEMSGENLYLVSKEGVLLGSTKIEKGLKIEFGDVDDDLLSVPSTTEGVNKIAFSIEEDYIRVSGLTQPTVVRIFSTNGLLVKSIMLAADREENIDLASLHKGIYILQINTEILKLQKK